MDLYKIRTGVELKLYELTQVIVSEQGYELYDMEYIGGSSTLRVFIMDSETKTAVIEDCIKVDRAFNPYCETEAWIPDDFVLEVSSPGVYRSLKTEKHFLDAKNDYVLLTLKGNLNDEVVKELPKKYKKEKKIRVLLKNIQTDKISVNLDGVDFDLGFDEIKKASLDPDLRG